MGSPYGAQLAASEEPCSELLSAKLSSVCVVTGVGRCTWGGGECADHGYRAYQLRRMGSVGYHVGVVQYVTAVKSLGDGGSGGDAGYRNGWWSLVTFHFRGLVFHTDGCVAVVFHLQRQEGDRADTTEFL